jgi:hypothetical protein
MSRCPDLRVDAALRPSQTPMGSVTVRSRGPAEQRKARLRATNQRRNQAPLTAYSGGTVWELHPLRVAAGASVKL